jgi:hypothetical protein
MSANTTLIAPYYLIAEECNNGQKIKKNATTGDCNFQEQFQIVSTGKINKVIPFFPGYAHNWNGVV